MDTLQIFASLIFILTYIGIIFTRLPWVNIDRPSAAFFGAVAMMAIGVVDLDESVLAIDFSTIYLLLGMMIIITSLQLDGFFGLLSSYLIRLAGNQKKFLWIVIFLTGIGSAFMVNDVVVLILTPIIINVCRLNKLNPLPFLAAEILACNAGSVMSMTGNPQNMLIGLHSGFSYGQFMLHLAPIAILAMLVSAGVVLMVYHSDFRGIKSLHTNEIKPKHKLASMRISVAVFLAVIVLFFFSRSIGISLPMLALAGAAVILLFGKTRPSKVIKEVDWVLLLFFASLFIVVHSVEKVGLLERMNQVSISAESLGGLAILHSLSLFMSQIVSNVPYAIAILPLMKSLDSQTLWLALASSATLAGNATIIGAVANLIVIESAGKQGIRIRFMEFLKPGLIATVISLVISVLVLYIQGAAGLI